MTTNDFRFLDANYCPTCKLHLDDHVRYADGVALWEGCAAAEAAAHAMVEALAAREADASFDAYVNAFEPPADEVLFVPSDRCPRHPGELIAVRGFSVPCGLCEIAGDMDVEREREQAHF